MPTETQTPPADTQPKEPSSFTSLLSENPEFQERWENAQKVTELQKKGQPIPENLQRQSADAEAAELEKAIAAKPEEAEERPFKSEKANANWKKLKEENRQRDAEAKKRIDELTQELAVAKAGGASKAELDAIRAERDQERQMRAQYEDELKLLAVERHPKFKAHFDTKLEKAINMAKQYVGSENSERLAQLLRLPDSDYKTAQLDEIANSLGGVKASMFGAALIEYNRVNQEREEERGKYRERYDAMIASKKREEEENAKQMQSIFEAQLAQMTDPEKGFALFRPKEKDDAWNAEVSARLGIARSVFEGDLNPQERASISFWAAAAPEYAKMNVALGKENAELRKQLEALSANKPKPGEGGQGAQESAEPETTGSSFTSPENIARIAQKLGR